MTCAVKYQFVIVVLIGDEITSAVRDNLYLLDAGTSFKTNIYTAIKQHGVDGIALHSITSLDKDILIEILFTIVLGIKEYIICSCKVVRISMRRTEVCVARISNLHTVTNM